MTNSETPVHLPSLPNSCSAQMAIEFLAHAEQLVEANDRFFNKDEIKSVEHSRLREKALVQALHTMAVCYNAKLKPIWGIDTRGELAVNAEEGGRYGEGFAAVLSLFNTRTGTTWTKGYVIPENNWCYMNHFEVERMVMAFREILLIPVSEFSP